jgi:hypothetical protein
MKVREALVQGGHAQLQTSFCMYKEVLHQENRRSSIQFQQLRIVMWPSQDAKRLSHVFRSATSNRLLVLLGPVVPRRSCTAAMLNQVSSLVTHSVRHLFLSAHYLLLLDDADGLTNSSPW